jgi:hypothetical protein
MYESDSDSSEDGSDEFWSIVLGGAQVAQKYVELYVDKNPSRIANTSGMGWLLETLKTPGECHRQLRMSTEIFICTRNESNRKTQNRFNHSGETISMKFSEVLDSVMAMAKHFIVPKDANFHTVHKRIAEDRRAYPHFKDCIGALDGTHVRVSLHPNEQVRYIGKTGIPTQNILAISDFDMRFTYVSVGQPGSMHDTSVLYNAIKVDKKFFPHPPKGNVVE